MRQVRVVSFLGLMLAWLGLNQPLLASVLPPRQARKVPIPPPTIPVATLLESLRSGDETTRVLAAWQLAGVVNPPDEVVTALLRAANDSDRKLRYAAQWALGHVQAGPKPGTSGDEGSSQGAASEAQSTDAPHMHVKSR